MRTACYGCLWHLDTKNELETIADPLYFRGYTKEILISFFIDCIWIGYNHKAKGFSSHSGYSW